MANKSTFSSEEIFSLDSKHITKTYARAPIALVRGEGAVACDPEGRRFIDFGSGIGVNSFGFCDAEYVRAVTEQLISIQHCSNLYYTEPCARLAELLCEKSGMKRVFFGNSGAEANEGVIKIIRKYAHDKYGDARNRIITLTNSFHGRTITTLAATGQDVFHHDFGPFPEGFSHVDIGDCDAVRALVAGGDCAGIMVETVQGEGGVNTVPADFLKFLDEITEENDMLLAVDEVQTGCGRTGEFFSYMHFGITPDVVSAAKGLGGGLPIGAVLVGERAENVLGPGNHGSTFGGNPVCCAGAISVVTRLDEEFLAGVVASAERMRAKLASIPEVTALTGLGLMIGVELDPALGIKTADVLAACRDRGLLVLSAKTRVRMLPPLNISDEAIDEGCKIFAEVCASLKAKQ